MLNAVCAENVDFVARPTSYVANAKCCVCRVCVDFVARPTRYVANAERCVCRVCASRVTHRASPVAGRPPVTASSVHLAMSDRGSLQRATKPCCGTCWTRQ